ncbi:MAG: TonB-dependent receptor [Pseudomonadota bacterium]|nr:TonB-dependent receptor [Pseudomonadota bacterium]
MSLHSYPRTVISILILQAYAGYSSTAMAQDPRATGSAIETIVIDAQRTTSSVARMAQEEAPNLINVMTVEEMRKLPDVNIAESVRRIPGISLETDTGEGRYINIRGIDADLNSTTFGGLRLPPSNNASPFGGGRAVALDAIPTGLVGAITVTKSNLPEQDAEALGGTIEITPKTVPRNGKFFFDGRIGTGREQLRGTGITDLSISTGTRFGGRTDAPGALEGASDKPFSVVFTASYYEDKRGIDDVEPAFIDDGVNAPLAYAGWDQRYYQYNRKRHGVGVDLGYKPDRDNSFYVRAFDAGYTETVLRNRLTITPDGAPTFANGQFTDGVTVNGFDKTLRDEKERINNKVYALGGKNLIGESVLDYRVGLTRGSFTKLYDYNSDFNFTPPSGSVTYDNSGKGNTPRFVVNGADYLNPGNYTLAGFRNSTQDIRDRENSFVTNLKMPVNLFGHEEESAKVGVSARWRKRNADGQPYSYKNLPALPLTAAAQGGNVNFYDGAYDNGPQISPGSLQQSLAANQTVSSSDTINAALQSQQQKENVFAAYGQYQMRQGKFGLIGGLRVEKTHADYQANAELIDASGAASVSPVSASRSYTNYFPSLQMKYEWMPATVVRATYSSTIARPGFNQISPSMVINPSAGFISTGNPDLKPITANSFDVALERYLPDSGIMAIGLFDKEFSNYIASSVSNQSFPNTGLYAGFTGPAKVLSFSNISKSYARGLELNYEQRFKTLPGIWSGLGASMNYTMVDSRFEIRPGEYAALPSTSRHTANASVFYEKNGLNMRLAGYYLSRNLFAISGSSTAPDVYSDARFALDFGSSYAINKQISIYFDAKNLTNTPLKFSEGSTDRTIQREFYGATYQVGMNLSF